MSGARYLPVIERGEAFEAIEDLAPARRSDAVDVVVGAAAAADLDELDHTQRRELGDVMRDRARRKHERTLTTR
jgi:hypothetical protein